MSDQSLGHWLRRERERRNITLRSISDQTKVALSLLQGLEDDDVSRWPGGIFRRAFVRAYASAIGLDPEAIVKRFELEHGGGEPSQAPGTPTAPPAESHTGSPGPQPLAAVLERASAHAALPSRARILGTAADLTIALVFGLGCAAAGSRLLWPVLVIAAYYAAGVLLTGTSPMVALLKGELAPTPAPAASQAAVEPPPASAGRRTTMQRPLRVVRTSTRTARQRAQ